MAGLFITADRSVTGMDAGDNRVGVPEDGLPMRRRAAAIVGEEREDIGVWVFGVPLAEPSVD